MGLLGKSFRHVIDDYYRLLLAESMIGFYGRFAYIHWDLHLLK